MPIMFLTGYVQRAMEQQVTVIETVLYTVLGIVIYMALHGYLLATRGQSIGKMLLSIRIVDYNTDEILPLAKLVGLRLAPLWILTMVPYVGCLGLVDALFIFRNEQRCIHDLIAGTKVVKV